MPEPFPGPGHGARWEASTGACWRVDWQGRYGGLVVQDRSAGQDLLRPPVDFQHVGAYPLPSLSTIKAEMWRPVPPAGYVALET